MNERIKIGFSGGCHWCTEAIFKQLKGVMKVRQGYISSISPLNSFSEAIIVTYNPSKINLYDLIEIHLNTHASTKNHSFRDKYRSAVYYFNNSQSEAITKSIENLRVKNSKNYITKVLKFSEFNESRAQIQDYYYKHPEAPFCKRYILPKITLLKKNYSSLICTDFDFPKAT